MPTRKSRLDGPASDLNSAAIHLLRGLRATDRAAGLTPARLSALSVIVFGGPCPLGRLARAEDVALEKRAAGAGERTRRDPELLTSLLVSPLD